MQKGETGCWYSVIMPYSDSLMPRAVAGSSEAPVRNARGFSLTRFQIRIAVDELQIELESIDLPIRVQLSEMEIIASDEYSRVLIRFIRKKMVGDTVAVRRGLMAIDLHGIIPRLVVNRFQCLQPLIPRIHNLLRRHRRGSPARQGGHIEQDFIRKAAFDLGPVPVVGSHEQIVDHPDNPIFLEKDFDWVCHDIPQLIQSHLNQSTHRPEFAGSESMN